MFAHQFSVVLELRRMENKLKFESYVLFVWTFHRGFDENKYALAARNNISYLCILSNRRTISISIYISKFILFYFLHIIKSTVKIRKNRSNSRSTNAYNMYISMYCVESLTQSFYTQNFSFFFHISLSFSLFLCSLLHRIQFY